MSADPQVMLMDEPFGALDPITREGLQNEFLRLQQEIRKTVVFVTHDIDEAVKIGDRIAVFGTDSRIAQFGPPERILLHPANDFVRDFIGTEASLKRLSLVRAADIRLRDWPLVDTAADGDAPARADLGGSGQSPMLALDDRRRPLRWVEVGELAARDRPPDALGLPVREVLGLEATLRRVIDELTTSSSGAVVIVDDQGAYRGAIDMDTIRAALRDLHAAQQPADPNAARPSGHQQAGV
jgi:osmoprotectant transport system ATP-binding protein